ncbi:unnamed protein product [Amoebophrya sp. A25]|nr:unnamed protein product [Amoebophrya sp. A25]|eukprot:GSA25T00014749001.1
MAQQLLSVLKAEAISKQLQQLQRDCEQTLSVRQNLHDQLKTASTNYDRERRRNVELLTKLAEGRRELGDAEARAVEWQERSQSLEDELLTAYENMASLSEELTSLRIQNKRLRGEGEKVKS